MAVNYIRGQMEKRVSMGIGFELGLRSIILSECCKWG